MMGSFSKQSRQELMLKDFNEVLQYNTVLISAVMWYYILKDKPISYLKLIVFWGMSMLLTAVNYFMSMHGFGDAFFIATALQLLAIICLMARSIIYGY